MHFHWHIREFLISPLLRIEPYFLAVHIKDCNIRQVIIAVNIINAKAIIIIPIIKHIIENLRLAAYDILLAIVGKLIIALQCVGIVKRDNLIPVLQLDNLSCRCTVFVNSVPCSLYDNLSFIIIQLQPDSAARKLLNLSEADSRVKIEILEEKEQLARVRISFQTGSGEADGETVEVEMIQPWGAEGIWVPRLER